MTPRRRVFAAIQVRMGSTRLPRKAMLPVAGRPMTEWIARRLKSCASLDGVILSTSDLPQNDPLEALARRLRLPCFRGPETDLVTRLLGTARACKADALVRVTGDCPLVDPGLVDRLAAEYRAQPSWELVTNIFPPTFPDGLDLEVYPARTLERLDREIHDPLHREWFPTYVMKRPEGFRIRNIARRPSLKHLRWTVDFPEDIELARRIFRALGRGGRTFGYEEILALVERRPELREINARRADNAVKGGIRGAAYRRLAAKGGLS